MSLKIPGHLTFVLLQHASICKCRHGKDILKMIKKMNSLNFAGNFITRLQQFSRKRREKHHVLHIIKFTKLTIIITFFKK